MNRQLRFSKQSIYLMIAIGITLFFWASAFVGIRLALQTYSPYHLGLLRYLTASMVLIPVALCKKIRMPNLRELPVLLLAGVIGIGGYNVALNVGEQTVTASSASFVINTAPILTAIFAVLALKEKLPWLGWFGIGISFIGVSFITIGEGNGLSLSSGILAIFLAALLHSGYIILQKKLFQRYTSFEVTAFSIWFGTLFLLLFSKGSLTAIAHARIEPTLAIVYLGIFPGAIAYFTWSYTLSKLNASKAASFLFLIPLLTIAIEFLCLRQMPRPIAIIGGITAIGGVIVTNLGKRHLANKTAVNQSSS